MREHRPEIKSEGGHHAYSGQEYLPDRPFGEGFAQRRTGRFRVLPPGSLVVPQGAHRVEPETVGPKVSPSCPDRLHPVGAGVGGCAQSSGHLCARGSILVLDRFGPRLVGGRLFRRRGMDRNGLEITLSSFLRRDTHHNALPREGSLKCDGDPLRRFRYQTHMVPARCRPRTAESGRCDQHADRVFLNIRWAHHCRREHRWNSPPLYRVPCL